MLDKINIATFSRVTSLILPFLILASIFCFSVGIYYSLFNSPSDYQQGEMVRIMYIHVPAAWMSLMIYSIIAVCSLSYLIWYNQISKLIAHMSASIGCMFAFIALVTGSIWGKPTWGTWWVFDARLTSMLILFLFYIAYLSLYQNIEDEDRKAKTCSILAIFGFINVPIVKFSVNFWNSLHQPSSILKLSGPTIHKSMLIPLAYMSAAFLLYYLIILIIKIDSYKKKIKIRNYSFRSKK